MTTNLAGLEQMVGRGEKIAMLTCYDATFAKLMAEHGVDVLLVGDSLGMVLQGAKNTLSVSIESMVYHTRAVAAGAPQTMILADMPAGSYDHREMALKNARLLMEAGAHMIKFEGGGDLANTARHLVQNGVPVCAHLGFMPQHVDELGGYKVQGKTEEGAARILSDAKAMKEAGASLVLLEMIPATLAAEVTAIVPTIGIGAGPACSGQVLVLQDLLGIYSGPADKPVAEYKSPRFAKNFLKQGGSVQQAVADYVQAVKTGTFPSVEHSY
jgi:3-methyl-2-oxobutanoate hydroxymethyltransferase